MCTFALAIRNDAQMAESVDALVSQMAESVDALVSNTSGVTSIPVRPRVWVQNKRLSIELSITYPFYLSDFSRIFPTCEKR